MLSKWVSEVYRVGWCASIVGGWGGAEGGQTISALDLYRTTHLHLGKSEREFVSYLRFAIKRERERTNWIRKGQLQVSIHLRLYNCTALCVLYSCIDAADFYRSNTEKCTNFLSLSLSLLLYPFDHLIDSMYVSELAVYDIVEQSNQYSG